jgi:hypothetical protein
MYAPEVGRGSGSQKEESRRERRGEGVEVKRRRAGERGGARGITRWAC